MRRKTNASAKIISVILSVLMVFAVIPLSAAAQYPKEYSYAPNTNFLKSIAVSESWNKDNALNRIRATGCYLLNYDLNDNAGYPYIYMGWNYTANPCDAIRGVRVDARNNKNPPYSYVQNGVTWYKANSGAPADIVPKLNSDGVVDLNNDVPGPSLYIYVTKDPAFGPPLTNISYVHNAYSKGESKALDKLRNDLLNYGYTQVVSFSDNNKPVDLNDGNPGDYIYLAYISSCTQVDTSALRNKIVEAGEYVGSPNYTSSSKAVVQNKINAAETILHDFDTHCGCSTKTQSDINSAANAIENALNELKTSVYLKAIPNGGESDQTAEVKIGKKRTGIINLGAYSATRAGWEFLGWNKEQSSHEGKTGMESVGFNETRYAIFKRDVPATFRYLKADGRFGTIKKYASAYNIEETAWVNQPTTASASVEYNGKTLNLAGWRTDGVAAAPQSAGGINVPTEGPGALVNAIYTLPLTLSYDLNGGSGDLPEPETKPQYINVGTEAVYQQVEFTISDKTPTPPPTSEGFGPGEFKGWADGPQSSEAQYFAGGSIFCAEDKTIFAYYQMPGYTVRFLDANGGILKTQTVPFGGDATPPESNPEKATDEENRYTFKEWTNYKNITNNTDVHPIFNEYPHDWLIETTATCTEAGTERRVCQECGYEIIRDVGPLGHDYQVTDPGFPARCLENGTKDYIVCARCGAFKQDENGENYDGSPIPALGHDMQFKEKVEATCSAGGYELWECSRCHITEERAKTSPDPTKHVETPVEGTAATCVTDGLTDGTVCALCGAVIIPQQVILSDGHNIVIDPAVPATCTSTGLTEGQHCADCGAVLLEQTVTPALGHDFVDVEAVAPTCEEDGYYAFRYCTRCNCIELTDPEAIAAGITDILRTAIGHDYVSEHFPATCTEPEHIVYTCSHDPTHTYTETIGEPLGHTGGTATCVEQAICERCGLPYGELAEHSYEISAIMPSNCTEKGYTEYTCSVCGDSYKVYESKFGDHDYITEITQEPTCTGNGTMTHTCKYCGHSYTTSIPALGHKVERWEVREDGMAYGICVRCGEELRANPHDVGVEIPKCERCGYRHVYNYGFFRYKGIYCNIVYFFRQVTQFFQNLFKIR